MPGPWYSVGQVRHLFTKHIFLQCFAWLKVQKHAFFLEEIGGNGIELVLFEKLKFK